MIPAPECPCSPPLCPQPVQAERGLAKAWVLASGQICSVDLAFMDWFGYKPSEMMGSSITSVLTEAKVLEEVLAGGRASNLQTSHLSKSPDVMLFTSHVSLFAEVKNSSLSGDRTGTINVDMGDSITPIDYKVSSGDVIISGRHVRHKFNDPVQVCMCVCMCIRGEGGHVRVCMYVRLCVRGSLLLAQARADAPGCRRHEHHDVPN